MPDGVTVADSSCLIALQAAGLIHVLPSLYAEIVVPEAVALEVGTPLPVWVRIEDVKGRTVVDALRVELGAGEAEAIALCIENSASRLILDDKKARRTAARLQLPVTGTLAVLLRAKQHGLITSVKNALAALDVANFRVSEALAREVLRLAGE
jgi:predicted nucleic acid-binding protein